jgi:hypothetical protein
LIPILLHHGHSLECPFFFGMIKLPKESSRESAIYSRKLSRRS